MYDEAGLNGCRSLLLAGAHIHRLHIHILLRENPGQFQQKSFLIIRINLDLRQILPACLFRYFTFPLSLNKPCTLRLREMKHIHAVRAVDG